MALDLVGSLLVRGNVATTVGGHVERTIVYNTAITADRAVTFNTDGMAVGKSYRVVRTAAATGAFNVNVVHTAGTKALTAGTWCDVQWDGTTMWLTAESP